MSRGKNNGFRRGNRTLAWYLDSKTLDRVDNQERGDYPNLTQYFVVSENSFPPSMHGRKNSFDSESSLNSTQGNGQRMGNESGEERKRRANKTHGNRRRNNQNVKYPVDDPNRDLHTSEEHRSDPIPISRNGAKELSSIGSDQQPSVLQQHFLALSAQVQAAATQKENYWYYDQNSQGFYYELSGSRGWRKFNPKIHGNPPLSVSNKPTEEATPGTQTVYVPIPVPVFTNSTKFFSQSGTSPNIKYYDPNSDGLFYETASVDGWKKRNPASSSSSLNNTAPAGQSPRVESLVAFPPLRRNLTSTELEELVLAKVKPNTNEKNSLPFASVVSRGLSKHIVHRQPEPEYPSSSSTVSSSVSSDDVTPPPANIGGKENRCQHQPFTQTKEPIVGSFEEPYEFYWSDNEKSENIQQPEHASSVSSVDEFNPLSAYFNEMSVQKEAGKQKIRVQRPSSLKIMNPPQVNNVDKRLPNFNIDRFIADLPGNDNFMYAPFGTDSPRTPFNQCVFTKESPMFTPMLPKENVWSRFSNFKQEEYKALAESSIERGLKDIEKIWN